MGLSQYPVAFIDSTDKTTKQMAVVVEIDGVPELMTLGEIYTRVRYGDNGIYYGIDGLNYGGLRRIEGARPYLTLEGSLSISQRLEPEQGRASISTFSLVFVDKDNYLTNLVSPGIVVDEIMGSKEVKIYIGYVETSWPDDYFVVFRGRITSINVNGPKLTLGLSDANQKRRRQLFNIAPTKLSLAINNSQTNIPVISATDFYQRILGPDGNYSSIVKTWIKIDDEWIQYDVKGTNYITALARSSTPTPIGYTANTVDVHALDADVNGAIEIGPENGIIIALKIMLSGWNGPWITGLQPEALGDTLDVNNTSTNVIKVPFNKDSKVQWGIVTGDYIYITGSAFNDGTYTVTGFDEDSSGRLNRIIYLNQNLIPEFPTAGTFSIRSQFDVLPVAAGLRMNPSEVDIDTHILFKERFLSAPYYDMQFTIMEKISGKEFIESQIYLPLGCYSLTRYGKVSIGYTRPPVLIDDKLIEINASNIVNPTNMTYSRALNTRRFYNEIDYEWDVNSDKNIYTNIIRNLDQNSLNLFGEESSLLVSAKGVWSTLGGDQLAYRTARALLTRYSNIAFEITLDVNMTAGSLVESGDIVMLVDNGQLQLPNLADGTRDIGQMLFEVLDRQLDIKTGTSKIKLLSGIFDTSQDRYGVVSPRSYLQSGSTVSILKLQGVNEFTKWTAHIGQQIQVHNDDWTYDYYSRIVSLSPTNSNWLIIDPPLPTAPGLDYVVVIPYYSTSTDKTVNKGYKSLYAHLAPSVAVTAGVSGTQFTVNVADISKFFLNAVVLIHTEDYSTMSVEVRVDSISGNDVILNNDIGFTPDNTMRCEFIGFADTQGAYRYF
jgi:hypothetical protein